MFVLEGIRVSPRETNQTLMMTTNRRSNTAAVVVRASEHLLKTNVFLAKTLAVSIRVWVAGLDLSKAFDHFIGQH